MNHLERALDGQNQWWKYLVVILVGLIGANIIGSIPLLVVMMSKAKNLDEPFDPSTGILDLEAYGIDPVLGLVLMMIPFVVGLILIVMMFKPLHKRSATEVINGTGSLRWGRFFFAAFVWVAAMVVYLAVEYALDPANFQINFNAASFAFLFIVSIVMIPLQTTFEEILFRGYLTQGVGAWTRSRLLAILLPAILFALIHAANPEVGEYGFWKVMPQYLIFGLLFGLVTILDDGIETAMGAHAANNVFLSLFLTAEASALQTPAVFKQLEVNPVKDSVILFVVASMFVLVLARKYGWRYRTLNNKVSD